MEKVKQFYDALTNSEEMKEKALKLSEKLGDGIDEEAASAEIIAFAASEGYDFTAEELAAFKEAAKIREVPDGELDAVAGGGLNGCSCWDTCFCVIGGGGEQYSTQIFCVCPYAGGGKSCEHGNRLVCALIGAIGFGAIDLL